MSAASPIPAASYIRTSTANATEATGQRRLCQQTAEHNGEHIPPHFEIHQPATFDEALQLVVTGQATTLYVGARLDRLGRRAASRLGLALDELDRVGGRIVFAADGLDTSRPEDRRAIAHLAEQARVEAPARR
jgi:DNA invertase Pin-like site-specific DNA recombinase